MPLHNPIEYIADEKGRVKQMRLQKMTLGEPDASGRRSPVEIPGAIDTIDVDTVIVSIGVSPNPLVPSSIQNLDVSKWGTITVNEGMVQKYLGRISGPLLDRIDIHIEIVPVPFDKLSEETTPEPSTAIRERVINARLIQEERFKESTGVYCNAQMSSKQLRTYATPDAAGSALLKNAMIGNRAQFGS